MRPSGPRYPIDRYLVESSNKIEMVNIVDEDIWNSAPALRPEEEIVLRKLHEMLQSTADDLKLLSGELARTREPGVQVRAAPAPLDEEFNEKVHIEEVVNAKFHGYKIKDNIPNLKEPEPKIKKPHKNVPHINASTQVNSQSVNKKPNATKRLTVSRTNVVQINATQSTKLDKVDDKKAVKKTVVYNEFSYQYPKPKATNLTKGLQVQVMPSINIRGELKEQKVLHLDIIPESGNDIKKSEHKVNAAVITIEHDPPTLKSSENNTQEYHLQPNMTAKKPARKFTKMVTCESSTSTNNVSSDPQLVKGVPSFKNIKTSPKTASRLDQNKMKKNTLSRGETLKKTHLNMDEWRKKLSSVYGQPSSSKKVNTLLKPKRSVKKSSPKRMVNSSSNIAKPLNNAVYIPYSQLTLGGVSISDIEKEISHIPNKSNIPLNPILDKIISSKENSRDNSPRKNESRDSPKIFTTSDENLLQEVINIEKTVSKTLSKNVELKVKKSVSPKVSSDSTNPDTNETDSYDDDFEDDKSDKSVKQSQGNEVLPDKSTDNDAGNNEETDNNFELKAPEQKSIRNVSYSKGPKLSLKNRVDVFEYVHSIDTQDTATQSQTTSKISLKETQTSPRTESPNVPIQPIHNDLWPSVDPGKTVEKLFKLEKDLIKKLIIDEYGDLLQNSIDKPSTSNENRDLLDTSVNIAASQKVTQTSPKHVKSVMTSPTKTKTRTTSPFPLSRSVDHQTSPLIFITNENQVKLEIEQEAEDLGISINLSSPRFSLRLPNTSVEVLSNLEICSGSASNMTRQKEQDVAKEGINKQILSRKQDRRGLSKPSRQNVTSSTSIDADNSSSDISSLGEVKLKLKKKLRKNHILSLSDTSTSSSKLSGDLNTTSILPLRSEGEVSLSHRARYRNTSCIPSKSEGEMSFGNL